MSENNKDLLKEAHELCEAATPGPWKAKEYDSGYKWNEIEHKYNIIAPEGAWRDPIIGDFEWESDAKFIAAARTLVPELVELCECQQRGLEAGQLEIDRLKARAEEAEAEIKRLTAKLSVTENNLRQADESRVILRGKIRDKESKIDALEARISIDEIKYALRKERAEEAEQKVKVLEKTLAGHCGYCIHSEVSIGDSPCKCCGIGDAWRFDYKRFGENAANIRS